MTVLRGVALMGLVVGLGCAGKPAGVRWAAHAQAGDQPIPIKDASDVVDVYKSVLGDPETISIEQVSRTVIVLKTSSGASHQLSLQPDGTLAIPGHQGARLIRRACRVFLQITWASRWALYKAMSDEAATPVKDDC